MQEQDSAVLDKVIEQVPQSTPQQSRLSKPNPPKQEENFYVKVAVEKGFLKPDSPLVWSTLAGNKGIDFFNWASDESLLLQFRESELKHGRLAMLAALGWATSELIHPSLSRLFGAGSLLSPAASGALTKAPSVLNGGLERVSYGLWVAGFVLAAVLEFPRMLDIAENPNRFKPGSLGFDPLKFYEQADADERVSLEVKEVNHGRLAMLGIAVMALKEWLFNAAIVDQSPEYFTRGPLSNIGALGGLLGQYSGLLSCSSGIVYCADPATQNALDSLLNQDPAASAEYLQEIMGSLLLL